MGQKASAPSSSSPRQRYSTNPADSPNPPTSSTGLHSRNRAVSLGNVPSSSNGHSSNMRAHDSDSSPDETVFIRRHPNAFPVHMFNFDQHENNTVNRHPHLPNWFRRFRTLPQTSNYNHNLPYSNNERIDLHHDLQSTSQNQSLQTFPMRFKCPVCNKTLQPGDIEVHLVMCLTKPRIRYNEDILTEDKGECVICFDDLKQGDTIARLPCLCIYHKPCIDNWFEVNRSCPEHPQD